MKSKILERKIIKATKQKDYEKAKCILTNIYLKHFKKMLKYKKIKVEKNWYLYDYILNMQKVYSKMYSKDLDEMINVLYTSKDTLKDQISWLIDNCWIFNDYK